MKRRPRITIAQAFDMVPMGGSVLMRWPVAELQAEADKRNARLSGEWYSITVMHDSFRDVTSALVTRSEQWASAREERLLGLMRFANGCNLGSYHIGVGESSQRG